MGLGGGGLSPAAVQNQRVCLTLSVPSEWRDVPVEGTRHPARGLPRIKVL